MYKRLCYGVVHFLVVDNVILNDPVGERGFVGGLRPEQILSQELFIAGGMSSWHISLIAQSDVNSMPG